MPLEKLAPNLREIMEVALYQLRHLDRIPAYAAVSEAVDQARASGGEGAARLVNGVLRGILLLPAPAAPQSGGGRQEAGALARFYSHPEFLVERWLARFGAERTLRVLVADNASPRLDLLVNPRRTSREALAAALAAEGVETEPSPLAPLALTVLSGNPLRSRGLRGGAVRGPGRRVAASAAAAARGRPPRRPRGGPRAESRFSALAHGRARGRTAAVDRSWRRLGRVVENSRRLGFPQMRAVAADVAALPLSPGRFDRVLLDAPCSGTGTLRKNPEIRYRVTPAAIERLAREQEAALAAAAGLLAPGGSPALLDLQPRGGGERAGRRPRPRARCRGSSRRRSPRRRARAVSSRAPGFASCRTSAADGFTRAPAAAAVTRRRRRGDP